MTRAQLSEAENCKPLISCNKSGNPFPVKRFKIAKISRIIPVSSTSLPLAASSCAPCSGSASPMKSVKPIGHPTRGGLGWTPPR